MVPSFLAHGAVSSERPSCATSTATAACKVQKLSPLHAPTPFSSAVYRLKNSFRPQEQKNGRAENRVTDGKETLRLKRR